MSSVSSTSSAVDGLISGLDTGSIITKLLAVDAAPQTQLASKVTTAQSKVTAYQTVNARMAALQTAAENLQTAASWTAATATVSGTSLTATATTGANPGSLTLNVTKLASAKSVMSPGQNGIDPTSKTAGKDLGFPLDVVRDGVVVGTISPGTGTLNQVAAAINKASDLGVTATAVRVGENKYRLQLSSTKPGADNDFELVTPTNGTGTPKGTPLSLAEVADQSAEWSVLTTAQNAEAEIPVGENTPPITLTSSTNTFVDLMPGVSVTATAKGKSTITVASNPSAIADSVQALVDAANAAINEITRQSKAGTISASGTNTGSGALSGDSVLRSMKSQIVRAVTEAIGDGASAAQFGIQSKSDGTITFAKDKFLTAYAADPSGTQKALAPSSLDDKVSTSVVERLLKVAKSATNEDTGSLTNAIKGQNSAITDLTKRISDWDVRLAAKKVYYQKYYANLEVALGKLQSQSTWLSGQLSSLSSSGS